VPASLASGFEDIAGAARRHWLWRAMARQDLRRRHARTLLGPLWSSVSLALVVAALSFLFWQPLGTALPAYPVYVAVGVAIWQFLLATLGEAPAAFVAAADTIRAARLPLSAFVLRLVWRNLLVLAAQAPVVVAAMIICGIRPGPGWWTLPAAILLLALASGGAALLLATIGARFRDVPPIVSNLLQLLFFLTPILWVPQVLPAHRAWLVQLNPLAAFVDIVRAPLVGASAASASWAIASLLAVLLAGAGALLFGRCRASVPYWV